MLARDQLVAITISTYLTPPEMLRRSVQSALAQTHENIRVMVVSDGDPPSDKWWDPIEDLLGDERLSAIRRSPNVGRYAIDHDLVSQMAADGVAWWAPLDSDDWAEPDWIASLIPYSPGHDVVFAPHWIHRRPGVRPSVERVRRWDGTPTLRWHAHLSNLWSVAFVAEWGLTNPRWRIAWDTIMTSVPFLVGDVCISPQPHVHRQQRPGSLTTSPETGFRSPHRNEARRRCERIWAEMVAHPDRVKELLASA